jgi:NOL1/NOP2/fmu family ribosome biogenesis protein
MITGENASSLQEPFADILLIDAPCAGEGMMRKEPEAIRQWSPALVESCSHLQRQIGADAARSLKENGILIYSTCSYSMEENIKNVRHFIREFQMQPVPIPFPETWGITTIREEDALGYQLYPHKVKGEGLFIAVLKNVSPGEPKYRKARKPFHLFETSPAWLGSHLADPDTLVVRKNNPQLQIITAQAEAKANEALMYLPRAEAVAEAGELKGKDFVPSHFMAMAGLHHDRYEILDLDLSGALDYLERTVHSLPAVKQPGWYLCRFEGTLLGWAKYTTQGWKNHYPMNWRLRDRKPK